MCKWPLLRRCPEAERPFRCFIRNGDGHLTLSCVTPEETNQCIKCDSDSPDTPAGPPWEPSLAFVLVVVSVAIVAVLFCCVRQHNNADKNCWLDSHTETVLSKSVSVRSRYDSLFLSTLPPTAPIPRSLSELYLTSFIVVVLISQNDCAQDVDGDPDALDQARHRTLHRHHHPLHRRRQLSVPSSSKCVFAQAFCVKPFSPSA